MVELAYAMARLRPVLPPQISEDEIASHLLVQFMAGDREMPGEDAGGWFYEEAVRYLASRRCMRMAGRWLGIEAGVAAGDREALKEASLALALFGERLTPENGEARTLLSHALTRLGTYERLTAALYFLQGRSLPEIGAELDLPPDEVSAFFRKALREVLATAAAEAHRWNPCLAGHAGDRAGA